MGVQTWIRLLKKFYCVWIPQPRLLTCVRWCRRPINIGQLAMYFLTCFPFQIQVPNYSSVLNFWRKAYFCIASHVWHSLSYEWMTWLGCNFALRPKTCIEKRHENLGSIENGRGWLLIDLPPWHIDCLTGDWLTGAWSPGAWLTGDNLPGAWWSWLLPDEEWPVTCDWWLVNLYYGCL